MVELFYNIKKESEVMSVKLMRKYIWYIIFFVIFGLLGALMPYVGDDLNWQGHWGSQYFFSTDFLHYDGRYLGDLFVILLTRSKTFAFLLYGLCAITVIYLVQLIGKAIFPKGSQQLAMFLTSIGLLLVPAFIFQQTWGWHAGFANYVPSVIFPLFFIYLVCRYYDQFNHFRFSRFLEFAVLIFAIFSQFLAEHVTVLNCFNVVIFWIFLRQHFSSSVQRQYFIPLTIGNGIGFILMFINGAYWEILLGHDNYRKVGSSQGETLIPFIKYMFYSKKHTAFLLIGLTFLIFLMWLNYHKFHNFRQVLVNLLALLSCVVSILPFLIISPFGPRCLFLTYVLLLLVVVTNLVSLLNNYQKLAIPVAMLAVLIIGARFDYLAYNYGRIFELSKAYCIHQKKLQRKNNYVLNYPDTWYIWTANASDDRVFRSYYIGKKQKVVPVNYYQWDRYYMKPNKNNIRKLDKIIIKIARY